jgi:Polysaccharide lyase
LPAVRWTSALVGALATACLLAAPALAESACGKPGYSYAGVVTAKRMAGVSAVISARVSPQVESGDVSGWIGLGRVSVNGKRGLVRVGLLARPDGTIRLYYETRRGTGWFRRVGPLVQPGERHRVKVSRLRHTYRRWHVVIDGHQVGRKFKLGNGLRRLRAVATAESWDGGTPACNHFLYSFGRVRTRGPWGWRNVRARKLQDPGYKVFQRHRARFLATNATDAPVDAPAPTDPRVFAGDWETGDASQWSGNHWNRNVPLSDQFAVVPDPVRQGNFAARFTVRPGDKFGSTTGERSEVLYTGANEVEGDDVWYAWSTLFPSDWTTPAGWGYFAQWHSSYPVTPPVAFNVKGERILANVFSGAVDTGAAGFKAAYPVTDALERGVWNDFVVHAVWSSTAGSIQVWHRTGSNPFELKVDVAGIPTMQTVGGVVSSNYVKLGFYRNAEPSLVSIVYQDGFSRASTPQDLAPAFAGDAGFQALLDQIAPPPSV